MPTTLGFPDQPGLIAGDIFNQLKARIPEGVGSPAFIPLLQLAAGGAFSNAQQQSLLEFINAQRGATQGVDPADLAGRETEIRLGFDQVRDDLFNEIQGLGDVRRQQINEGADARLGTGLARLEARGLGGSTLSPVLQNRLEQIRQQELGGLEESLAERRAGIIGQHGEGVLGFLGNAFSELQRQRGQQNLANLEFGSGLLRNLL